MVFKVLLTSDHSTILWFAQEARVWLCGLSQALMCFVKVFYCCCLTGSPWKNIAFMFYSCMKVPFFYYCILFLHCVPKSQLVILWTKCVFFSCLCHWPSTSFSSYFMVSHCCWCKIWQLPSSTLLLWCAPAMLSLLIAMFFVTWQSSLLNR